MKVVRRHLSPVSYGKAETVLRFTTGKIVRVADCPKGIQAHGHWLFDGREHPDGEPNTICACREET